MDASGESRVPLPDFAATHAFARRLASVLRAGDVVALQGELGSGKTEFARAVIRARAGALIEVPSPTFTLIQDYQLPGLTIRHADLYRIDDPLELDELDLEELAGAALLVEWPERADERLPGERLEIRLEVAPDERRTAHLRAGPGWQARLSALLDA